MTALSERAAYSSETKLLEDFSQQVFSVLGSPITPRRIANVIRRSNEQSIVFHGIKHSSRLPSIEQSGILPLTPEGGQVSFWTSGKRIFGSLTGGGGINTYDSTFFHYAHSRERKSTMNIAVINVGLIQDATHITFSPDTVLQIKSELPRDVIQLLEVDLSIPGDTPINKTAVHALGQEMFILLERMLNGEYEPGGVMTNNVSSNFRSQKK